MNNIIRLTKKVSAKSKSLKKAALFFIFICYTAQPTAAQEAMGRPLFNLSHLYTSGNVSGSSLIYVVPFWRSTIRKSGDMTISSRPIGETEFNKWLKYYNNQSKGVLGYKHVLIKKIPSSGAYLICNEKFANDYAAKVNSPNMKLGAELDDHRRVFSDFSQNMNEYVKFFNTNIYTLNTIYSGKEIAEQLPIQFAKAISPVLTNDSLSNGMNIMVFYKDTSDTKPSYYYMGNTKNGLFEGIGLFLERKSSGRVYSKRGLFHEGIFAEKQKTDSILNRFLTKEYVKQKFGIDRLDSFKYSPVKENYYHSSDRNYNLQLELDLFSKNEKYAVAINLANSQFEGDDTVKIFSADPKITEYISRKTLKGTKLDEFTGYKFGDIEIKLSGYCRGADLTLIWESPVTVYSRKTTDGDWINLGTWTLVKVSPCDKPVIYGVNLINKDADYRSKDLVDRLLDNLFNSYDLKFEHTYASQDDAIKAIVKYALQKK